MFYCIRRKDGIIENMLHVSSGKESDQLRILYFAEIYLYGF